MSTATARLTTKDADVALVFMRDGWTLYDPPCNPAPLLIKAGHSAKPVSYAVLEWLMETGELTQNGPRSWVVLLDEVLERVTD